ncbi:hypothetical protein Efla_003686 [Eimeria flavescens]
MSAAGLSRAPALSSKGASPAGSSGAPVPASCFAVQQQSVSPAAAAGSSGQPPPAAGAAEAFSSTGEYGGLQHQHESVSADLESGIPPSEGPPGGPPPAQGPGTPLLPSPAPYESLWRLSALLLIAVGPFLSMLCFVSVVANVGAAMLWMHWICMLGAPAVYIHLTADGWSYYRLVAAAQGPSGGRWRRQGPWAVLAFLLGLSCCYCGSLLLQLLLRSVWGFDLTSELRVRCLSAGLHQSFPVCLLLAIYFLLVNPATEEFFWRVFLYRELGAGVFGSAAAGLLEISKPPGPLALRGGHLGPPLSPTHDRQQQQQGLQQQEQQQQEQQEKEEGGDDAAADAAADSGEAPLLHAEKESSPQKQRAPAAFLNPEIPAAINPVAEGVDCYVAHNTPPSLLREAAPRSPAAAAAAAAAAGSSSSSSSLRGEENNQGPGGSGTAVAYYDLRVPPLGHETSSSAAGKALCCCSCSNGSTPAAATAATAEVAATAAEVAATAATPSCCCEPSTRSSKRNSSNAKAAAEDAAAIGGISSSSSSRVFYTERPRPPPPFVGALDSVGLGLASY